MKRLQGGEVEVANEVPAQRYKAQPYMQKEAQSDELASAPVIYRQPQAQAPPKID